MSDLVIFGVFGASVVAFAVCNVFALKFLLKHVESQMELFRARSLDEKFALEAKREEARLYAEMQRAMFKEAGTKPPQQAPSVGDFVQTEDGKLVNMSSLVPDFGDMR